MTYYKEQKVPSLTWTHLYCVLEWRMVAKIGNVGLKWYHSGPLTCDLERSSDCFVVPSRELNNIFIHMMLHATKTMDPLYLHVVHLTMTCIIF